MNRRKFLTLSAGASLPAVLAPNLSSAAAATIAPSKVKITDVKVAVVRIKYPCVLVKVTTDAGIEGIGEALPRSGLEGQLLDLKSQLIGKDPTQIGVIYNDIMSRGVGKGAWAGLLPGAIGGIETALWDLTGKLLGVPVYTLLGGKLRDRILIYHDTGSPSTHDPQAWVDEAIRSKEYGFQAMKFDLNPSRRNPYETRALHPADIREWFKILEAVRDELGADFPLGIDFHWKYYPSEITNFIKAADYLNLWFVEDPISPTDPQSLRRITEETNIPIVTGENLHTRTTWKPFIEGKACDAIQPDTQRCGGLIETKWISEWAAMYGMPLFVHNLCTPVGTYASAHLCASQDSFMALESDSVEVPEWSEVVHHEGSFYKDGYLELNDKPGFGFELNEDLCKKYLITDYGFFS